MKAIGFATKFYTLWDIETESIFSTRVSANGENHFKSGEMHKCTYIKNISIDVEKVKNIYPDLDILEGLRGHSNSFEYETGKRSHIEYENDVFSKGYRKGEIIENCSDIRSLQWAFDNEDNTDRISNIENKLNQLGLYHYDYRWISKEAIQSLNENTERIKKVYSDCTNTSTITIQPLKNLAGNGIIEIDEITYAFPEHTKMYYNGFVYSIPTINGIGKRIKGKTLELVVKAGVYSYTSEYSGCEYECRALIVESFKII